MNNLSISIVVYKPDMAILSKTLESLDKAIYGVSFLQNICLYIIDNSPGMGYYVKLKNLLKDNFLSFGESFIRYEVVKAEKNLGYGYGNNIAIKKSSATYHLVLNPDVFLQEDTLFNAVNYMESNYDIGLLIPAVFGQNGERHYLCKKNPTIFDSFLHSFAPGFLKNVFHKRMEAFEMRHLDYSQIMIDVPFPTGCFMLFRTAVLKQLNGFDDRYFMYFEDADIGRRLLKFSHSVYVPNVKIFHVWARESHKNIKLMLVAIYSAWLYWYTWGGLF